MANFPCLSKGILSFIGLLLRFSTLAQVDDLHSKSSIESYVKTQLKYKTFELLPLSQTSGDSTLKKPYWLKGDFDNDGSIDLLTLAFVEKPKTSKHRELLVYLKKRNSFIQVSLDNYFTYEFFDRVQTSAATLSIGLMTKEVI